MHGIKGEVANKHCIIIDDIVDTAGTLCGATELLMTAGASSVMACVTHAVLSGNAIQLIENSALQKVYVTDSILHSMLSNKFKTLAVSGIFAKNLEN
jgi:ribose-phosphate pyrophosphokinase